MKLKTPKLVITSLPPMSAASESRLYRLMESFVEGVESQDFVPSRGMACACCEFIGKCQQWTGGRS